MAPKASISQSGSATDNSPPDAGVLANLHFDTPELPQLELGSIPGLQFDTFPVAADYARHLVGSANIRQGIEAAEARDDEGRGTGDVFLNDIDLVELGNFADERLIAHLVTSVTIGNLAFGTRWDRATNFHSMTSEQAVDDLARSIMFMQSWLSGAEDAGYFRDIEHRDCYLAHMRQFFEDTYPDAERNPALAALDLMAERWLLYQLLEHGVENIDILDGLWIMHSELDTDVEEGVDLEIICKLKSGQLVVLGLDVVNSSRILNFNRVCVAGNPGSEVPWAVEWTAARQTDVGDGSDRDNGRGVRRDINYWQGGERTPRVRPEDFNPPYVGPSEWNRTGSNAVNAVIPGHWLRYKMAIGALANPLAMDRERGYPPLSTDQLTARRVAEVMYADFYSRFENTSGDGNRYRVALDQPVIDSFRQLLMDAVGYTAPVPAEGDEKR
jgi:hypothetical protein